MSEAVDHPDHYGGDTTYETIKVLEAWLSPDEFRGFLRGNTLKYLSRLGKKDEALQDAKKAAWYLAREIEALEAQSVPEAVLGVVTPEAPAVPVVPLPVYDTVENPPRETTFDDYLASGGNISTAGSEGVLYNDASAEIVDAAAQIVLDNNSL